MEELSLCSIELDARLQQISPVHTLRALRLCESYLSVPFKFRTPLDKVS
jgi:hypothetical protein